jgi:hypothetical protein
MQNNPEMPASAPEQGDDEIEQLLAQLSPEQLEQLAAELSNYMQSPDQAGGGHVGDLASAIEAHLAQNPEAAAPEAIEPEKMAAFALVKSAAYIEGFLNHAIAEGADIKQAVDMYDSSLTETLANLKEAALKGNQHKLDVDKDGKIEASDLAKLRHEKSETPKQEKKEHKDKMEEIKEAAYFEGVLQRASEYGFSENAVMDIVKTAETGLDPEVAAFLQSHKPRIDEVLKGAKGVLTQLADKMPSATREVLPTTPMERLQKNVQDTFSAGTDYIKDNLPVLGGGAALGAGSLALAYYLNNRNKAKQNSNY